MRKILTLALVVIPLATLALELYPAARLTCPSCGSTNTWATYQHSPCGVNGGCTTWIEQAVGPSPDGRPYPLPCPSPGCEASHVPTVHVECRSCGLVW